MNDKEFNPRIDLFVDTLEKYIFRRFKRLKKISIDNELSDIDILNSLETSLKGSFYNHYRHIYNNRNKSIKISNEFSSAIYYFIREYCYASMFRYNKNGEFNIPYGGMAYNNKEIVNKIVNPKLIEFMQNTIIENMDFLKFLSKYNPTYNDFIFVEPPYDSDFSKYEQNDFSKSDHERLCSYLSKLNANIMIVIKKTEFIYNLYDSHGFNIYEFKKKYLVNCKNRNERNTIHLLITNYEIDYINDNLDSNI